MIDFEGRSPALREGRILAGDEYKRGRYQMDAALGATPGIIPSGIGVGRMDRSDLSFVSRGRQ